MDGWMNGWIDGRCLRKRSPSLLPVSQMLCNTLSGNACYESGRTHGRPRAVYLRAWVANFSPQVRAL